MHLLIFLSVSDFVRKSGFYGSIIRRCFAWFNTLLHIYNFSPFLHMYSCNTLKKKAVGKQFGTTCVCETLMPPKHPSIDKHDPDI